MWTDPQLAWDPDSFGGLTEIRLPIEYMWTPSIVLHNKYAQPTSVFYQCVFTTLVEFRQSFSGPYLRGFPGSTPSPNCYEGLSDSCRVHQIRFRPGLRPGPRWWSSRRSPKPPSRLGGDTPSPFPPPRRVRRLGLVACGDSFPKPLRNFFLDTALIIFWAARR